MGNKFQIVWKLLVAVFLALLPVTPVLAGSIASISIKMQFTTGLTNFTSTYKSDTEMDLSWLYNPLITENVMVRSSYNNFPSAPIDTNTAPTDGNLVYYGTGTSYADTSVNFDENPGPIYYTAYAQNLDGTWNLTINNNSEESKEVILIAFIGLFVGLLIVNIMARNSFTPQKLIAALAWVIPLIWVAESPPSFMTAGSAVQTATVVVLWGMLIICLVAAFRKNLQVSTKSEDRFGNIHTNSAEGSGWHLPGFMTPGANEEQQIQEMRRERSEKLQERRNRFRNALRGPDDDERR